VEEKKLCGIHLVEYLWNKGLPNREINDILDSIGRQEWEYTYFILSYSGFILDWDQSNVEIFVQPNIRKIVQSNLRKYKAFRIELWKNDPPDCLVFIARRGVFACLIAPSVSHDTR